jgi:hypothetical protein
MYGAGTALGNSTPKLGSSQADEIAQHPQERHIPWGVDAAILTIDA